VARLNFSHGTHAEHSAVYDMVRQISAERARPVGVLADLQGPKIRLGWFAAGPVVWATGEHIVITTAECPGDHDRVSTTYEGLAADVRPGDRLLVDDGKVDLRVVDVNGEDITCEVLQGGPVSDHKGISLPGVDVSVPPLSEKDIEDLKFALELGVDMVAMSFVRAPEEVKLAHAVMDEVGKWVPVMAKLEKPEAVSDLSAIVDAFDGLMVARGDLGVEMPLEQVPLVQKQAIGLCRQAAKPVIVATQMLESMIEHSRPTRAEASDVANAVLDGADAVMLSGETSVGRYPVQTVATMARIIDAVESDENTSAPPLQHAPRTQGGAIAQAAIEVATRLGACALVSFTETGDTARRLARHHCRIPLLAFTPDPAVRSRLALSWGVETYVTPAVAHTDEMVGAVQDAMLANGRGRPGDLVVVVAGSPPSTPGSTNMLRVHRLGDPAAD
jgi:pyruvate kinase